MFWTCFLSPFSSFNDEKLRHKYCNKQIITRDNVNVQSHDQEESKFNSSIIANSGAHTPAYDKIIKSPFNKNNLATIKKNNY